MCTQTTENTADFLTSRHQSAQRAPVGRHQLQPASMQWLMQQVDSRSLHNKLHSHQQYFPLQIISSHCTAGLFCWLLCLCLPSWSMCMGHCQLATALQAVTHSTAPCEGIGFQRLQTGKFIFRPLQGLSSHLLSQHQAVQQLQVLPDRRQCIGGDHAARCSCWHANSWCTGIATPAGA